MKLVLIVGILGSHDGDSLRGILHFLLTLGRPPRPSTIA
jgi:hypothetical protein